MKRWLIGDTHFFDKNIITFENRPFKTVEEMNTCLVNNWNSVVAEEDNVFLLGDVANTNNINKADLQKLIKSLNGNITLIAGNHDVDNLDFYAGGCKMKVYEYPILVDDFWILSHNPMYVNDMSPYANIFAHVHNNLIYKTVTRRSYCVSAERIHFTPINFDEVVSEIMKYN